MKKTKTLIIAAMLVIMTLSVAIFAGCTGKSEGADVNLDFDGLGSAPTQEAKEKAVAVDKSKITLSDTDTTDQAVLDSIKYLLILANQNIIDCDFFAAAACGSGVAQMIITGDPIVGTMQTRDTRVFDNDTFFFDSYGRVVDGYKLKKNGKRGKDVSAATMEVLTKALNFNKRTYSPNNVDFYFTKDGKGDSDSIVKFPDQYAIIYKNPKVKKMTFDEYVKENWYRDSYKGFTDDDYTTERPITSGLLTYDETSGIYYLEAEINCDDCNSDYSQGTLSYPNSSMLANGAINEFRYSQKRVKVEIWDCGLIKTYINKNVWNATIIMNIKGSSENMYEQWYTYDKSKLDKLNIDQSLKDALVK